MIEIIIYDVATGLLWMELWVMKSVRLGHNVKDDGYLSFML